MDDLAIAVLVREMTGATTVMIDRPGHSTLSSSGCVGPGTTNPAVALTVTATAGAAPAAADTTFTPDKYPVDPRIAAALSAARKGDWVATYPSGLHVWPLDPLPEEIDIRDIAHHLATIPRYAGGTRVPISVAEHSCHVCDAAPPGRKYKLTGLLHDAPEYVFYDMQRPIKYLPHMAGYRAAQDAFYRVVAAKFDLFDPIPAVIKEIDGRMIMDEVHLLAPGARGWTPDERARWDITGGPVGVTVEGWEWRRAEREFLDRFFAFGGKQ